MESRHFKNKTVLITGASSGLGFEIAKAFLENAANLIICSRSEENLDYARQKLEKIKNYDQSILSIPTDISTQHEIDNLVEKSFEVFPKIEILVNNAGIIGPKGGFEFQDWEEWKHTLEINLFGSVYLIKKLLPSFKKNNFGRIIQISGGGATSPFPFQTAYAASKAGIVRFIESIALELEDYDISANCIAPGQLKTKILDEYLEAGPELLGKKFYDKVLKQINTAPISKPVGLALAMASNEFPLLKGKLISAIWDDWENISEFYEDLYTLRRVIAKDRSFNWGDL